MVQRTRRASYLVHEQGNSIWKNTAETRLWFEVLEGDDKGKRVSIPLYCELYSARMKARLHQLSDGDVVEAVLEREGPTDSWRPVLLEKTRKRENQGF